MGCVRTHCAELIGANKGSRKSSEKLIVIVELGAGLRVDIARVNRGMFQRFPAQHRQVLAIALMSGVEQPQLSGATCLVGIDVELTINSAVLKPQAEQEVRTQRSVELQTPA